MTDQNINQSTETAQAVLSKNAENFYRQYIANSGGLIVWITDSEESETYKAAEELRDAEIISIEIGQVFDADGNKIGDRFGVSAKGIESQPIKDFYTGEPSDLDHWVSYWKRGKEFEPAMKNKVFQIFKSTDGTYKLQETLYLPPKNNDWNYENRVVATGAKESIIATFESRTGEPPIFIAEDAIAGYNWHVG
jgi:hypothetical protein